MGEMADDLIEKNLSDFLFSRGKREATELLRNKPVANPKEWTTGQGEILKLSEMEDSHLLNTIAYIRRKMAEYDEIERSARARNFAVPPYRINKMPGHYWIDLMLIELNHRARARGAK